MVLPAAGFPHDRLRAMTWTRRHWIAASLGAGNLQPPPEKPNVVLIIADDFGWGDAGCYNPEARTRTPAIDQLAAGGVRFTDAHSASSVCTPSRYGILTGRYCWRTRLTNGVLNGESPSLIEPGRETLASMLKKQGYRTGGFGKWHLGLGPGGKTDYSAELRPGPNDFGFDEYFGIPASLDMPPYLFFENRRVLEAPTSQIAGNGAPPRGPFWRGGAIAPGFRMEDVLPKITERACRFIAHSAGQPFFAYVPLNAPHTPWVPSQDWKGKSKAGLYGDFVGQVDDSVRAITGQLRQQRALENTILIVTSDNGAPWAAQDAEAAGGHRANASWRGQKADIQEAGHRIPFIAHWPARFKPGVCRQTICLTDIFATLAGIHGVALASNTAEDSFSILPALLDPQRAAPVRDAIVHHSAQGLFAIRQGDWKLILGRGSGGFTQPAVIKPAPGEPEGELYNLAKDPHEDDNVYRQNPETVRRLTDLLALYRRQGHSRPM